MFKTQPGLRAVNLRKGRLLDRIAMQHAELAQEIRSLKLNWYTMRNLDGAPDGGDSPDAGSAEIFIYDEIGGSFGVGVTDFIAELNDISADQIVVRINSPGGLLVDAIAISSALQQHPSNIITRVDGIAASAASVVAIAGDRLEMMPGSQLMIHDVMVDISGNAADLKECIAWLNEQSMNVASMYAAKAAGEVDDWRALMLAETWMFAQEAVESGLADALFERPAKSAFPPTKPDDEPDGDEPEKPDEQEPDDGKNADSSDDEESDDEDKAQNALEVEALTVLMHRKHRLTNRGFRYLGRERAPEPALPETRNQFDDVLAAWG